jgi:Leucine-rich repeat (LRR) protein
MRTKLLLTVLFFAAINLVGFSQVFNKQGAGVTIIVHGWNPDGSQPAWMQNMADAIIARSGGAGKIGTITVSGSLGSLTATCSNWNFDLATQTSGEIVVLVNWTAVSNHLTMKVPAQDVAAVITPKIYQTQGSQPPLSELPVHLIGHSRGGGMVFEIARLLGLQGVEVEQVTALDPHPLTAADPQPITGNIIDTPIKLYENILFVDNYYQNIATPKGQYLTGAYNRLWTSLPGGYHNETGYTYNILGINYNFSDHLNIILAYHGTINLATPVTNGQATMTATERAWFNTYENAGQKSGFVYSLDIAGNRKTTDTPNSGDAVIAGYHNNSSLGGSGAREALNMSGSVWPNIFSVIISLNSTTLTAGNTYEIGGSDGLYFNNLPLRSYSKDGTVKFYLDNDRNPYNGAHLQDNSSYSLTGNSIVTANFGFQPTRLMDANYYALVEINDGTNKRYMYAPYQFYRYCTLNYNDDNFNAALLAIPGLDANNDGEIQCSEAAAWTGELNLSGKSIADLKGIESFTNITTLNCSNNQLTSLDLSSNTTLRNINFSNNLLTSVNLSANTAITTIYCQGNRLTSLNLSGNPNINYIQCSNNALQVLNVKNGNNTGISYFDARNNTKLSCIQVDNVAFSTTNWTNIDAGASYNTNCPTCEVNIPDASFKTALLNISGIDINSDGVIQCFEAAAFTNEINVNGNSISDMTGIEAFTNITQLNCGSNSISSINLSSNTSLTNLYCDNNQLTSLNISGLTSLTYIDCSYNKFTSLNFSGLSSLSKIYCNDNLLTSLNVSGLTSLTYLYCPDNRLASLDLSTNSTLEYLYCSNNLLTGLNVSGLTSLSEIECNNNQLTSLNISTNSALYSVKCEHNLLTSLLTGSTSLFQLWCGYNSLTGLNVSLNTSLANLYCYNNSITSLDISSNISLSYFECNNNSLTSLNVKNGNNTNFGSFNATNNPGLTCIQVDDAGWSTANWTNKDAGASFNTNCSSYTIAASVLPASSGTITGTGNYIHGTTVSLTATANSSYSFANWTESGSQVSTNATYTFTAAANRTLVANFQLITGFENLLEDISATVYPNPNNGKFTINFNNNFIGEITINIHSAAGAKLKTIKLNKSTSEMSYNVDMGNMPKGIYFIDLQTIKYKVVKKMIFK